MRAADAGALGINMTNDELIVLTAMRSLGAGTRLALQEIVTEARLPLDRVNKALEGLEASGHVWAMSGKFRLASDGTTFNT
jgi:hypothetical protein